MTGVEREGGGWEIARIRKGGIGKKEKAFYLFPFSLFSLFALPTPPHFYCAVTVIWAFPVTLTLTQIAKVGHAS